MMRMNLAVETILQQYGLFNDNPLYDTPIFGLTVCRLVGALGQSYWPLVMYSVSPPFQGHSNWPIALQGLKAPSLYDRLVLWIRNWKACGRRNMSCSLSWRKFCTKRTRAGKRHSSKSTSEWKCLSLGQGKTDSRYTLQGNIAKLNRLNRCRFHDFRDLIIEWLLMYISRV